MVQMMGQGRAESCVEPQLWQACAGRTIQMPEVNSKVYYCVQGHIEHASGLIDLKNFPRIPPAILCRVVAIKYLADDESDEVYAKICLVPVTSNEPHYDEVQRGVSRMEMDSLENMKPMAAMKVLTMSDANNGGGFSVPRLCADTIFPPLDYTADPPVQTLQPRDVRGKKWQFRHIYRGTPRRHLLTTGWSGFVDAKRLVENDSILFLKTEKGDLHVGIRRSTAKMKPLSEWDPESFYIRCLRKRMANGGKLPPTIKSRFTEKVTADSVIEAVKGAINGQPFEVLYYPSKDAAEFVVKATLVNSASRIHWFPKMRVKLLHEKDDSLDLVEFIGTISAVNAYDAAQWPESPWRLLKVTWDDPHFLRGVKQVSPWLVKIESPDPIPPKKKITLSEHRALAADRQLPMPKVLGSILGPSNPCGYLLRNSSAGMQGTRHSRFGLTSDLGSNKFQSAAGPVGHPTPGPAAAFLTRLSQEPGSTDNVSNTSGNSMPSTNNSGGKKMLRLFGRRIEVDEEMPERDVSNAENSSVNGRLEHSLSEVNMGGNQEVVSEPQEMDQDTAVMQSENAVSLKESKTNSSGNSLASSNAGEAKDSASGARLYANTILPPNVSRRQRS